MSILFTAELMQITWSTIMSRQFRILKISNPEKFGNLDQFVRVNIQYEYNPGDPLTNILETMTIHFSEIKYLAISNFQQNISTDTALSRIAWFAVNKFHNFLSGTSPIPREPVSPTDEEIEEMLQIDPQKIPYLATDWIEIRDSISSSRNTIFIGCGQRTDEEKELGEKISRLVKEMTDFEPYFAEYQHSLIGLTTNIFNALYESSAFIAVMHRRDLISESDALYRGSVWIEQEIALASFIVQTLGVNLPSKAYLENGIIQEGVRGYIHLNPMPFSSSEEILEELKEWLPKLSS